MKYTGLGKRVNKAEDSSPLFSVRRKSNRLRQRPLREDFLRRKNSVCSH